MASEILKCVVGLELFSERHISRSPQNNRCQIRTAVLEHKILEHDVPDIGDVHPASLLTSQIHQTLHSGSNGNQPGFGVKSALSSDGARGSIKILTIKEERVIPET